MGSVYILLRIKANASHTSCAIHYDAKSNLNGHFEDVKVQLCEEWNK